MDEIETMGVYDGLRKKIIVPKTTVGKEGSTSSRNISNTELAWAAGFFEAEGGVDIKKRKGNCYSVHASATNCDREMLLKLVPTFRGKIYPKRSIDERAVAQKQGWMMHISASIALRFFKSILPYMSPSSKRKQVELAICFQEKLLHPHSGHRRIGEAEISERHQCMISLRSLKHEDSSECPHADVVTVVDDTDVAWAAGFFEGEGGVDVAKRPSGDYLVKATASNCDSSMLAKISQLFGGGVYPKRKRKDLEDKRRSSWTWEIAADMAYRFYSAILPYTSLSLKRKQIELALEFQEKVIHPHGYSTVISAEEKAVRERYRVEVVKLKHVGEVPTQELINVKACRLRVA